MNVNWKSLIIGFSGLSVVLWLVLFALGDATPKRALDSLNTVFWLDGILFLLFSKICWNWKIFRWLKIVPFPDLRGTWEAVLATTWEDSKGQQPSPKKTHLVIRQDLLSINCVLYTDESTSFSYVGGFDIDEASGQKRLVYSYFNESRAGVQTRSIPHNGTCSLRIVEGDSIILKGKYWTDRQSTGDLELKFKSKTLAEDAPRQPRKRRS